MSYSKNILTRFGLELTGVSLFEIKRPWLPVLKCKNLMMNNSASMKHFHVDQIYIQTCSFIHIEHLYSTSSRKLLRSAENYSIIGVSTY